MSDPLAAAVAAQEAWMRDLLLELVALPTERGHEEPGQAAMARVLSDDCGCAVRDVWMDAEVLRAAPGSSPFGWDVSRTRNVVGERRGAGGGRSLILGGHMDVVPPAADELWSSPPYAPRVDGDWVYGRGAGDMKAGLVAICGALRALDACGIALAGDLQVHSVAEEECTGNGALQVLLDGARADGCVLTEPHPDHLTLAQVGVLWFHVDVLGAPAHAAYADRAGRNAIDAAHSVLAELRVLEQELCDERSGWYADHPHPINLNPGVIAGGDWPSTVAASCTLSCRLAMYPGTEPAELQARVEDAVARAAARDPFLAGRRPRVRYEGFTCEGCVVSDDEPLVHELGAAYARVHGRPPALQATTATTDARHYVRHGIPAVCFGPRAEAIHGIDERVSMRSVVECAEVLARFAVRWCGESRSHDPVADAATGLEESHVGR